MAHFPLDLATFDMIHIMTHTKHDGAGGAGAGEVAEAGAANRCDDVVVRDHRISH